MMRYLDSWTRLPDLSPQDMYSNVDLPIMVPTYIEGFNLLINPTTHCFALCFANLPSAETITHFLADLILPRLLASDGCFVLHCGIVISPNGALGFMGQSGRGKSTMSASLHSRGLPLMSDDAVVLKEHDCGYSAERIYPSLRLLPDSLGQIFSATDTTAPVADYTDKRHVAFAAGPDNSPLLALFRLTNPSEDIRVSRLAPAEACMALIANSFALNAADPAETRRRFIYASEVARRVPVYDLYYPRDYAAIPEVHALIFETLGLAAPEESPA